MKASKKFGIGSMSINGDYRLLEIAFELANNRIYNHLTY